MALLESTGLATTDSAAVHSGTDAAYQPAPTVPETVMGIGLALVAAFGTLAVVRLTARRSEAAEE